MFERFNAEARSTVVIAQEQARDLGHNYIGTEHVLLALLATEDTAAAATLRSLGVSLEDVRGDILAIVGPGEGASAGHIPFTPRSKKVLELSLREALALKHQSIAPEHILLGLIREGEGLAAQILVKHGVDLEGLRREVIGRLPPGTKRGRRGFRVPVPSFSAMTTGGARAADRAIERAGGAPVASQHYLLGLLDEDQSLAAKALAALGVTRADVETKLAELGTAGTSDEPPIQWGARNTSLEVIGDLLTVRLEDSDLAARVRNLYDRLHVAVLRGPDLPGAERLWGAVRPAIQDSVRRLEKESKAAAEWEPPGWAKAGVATFAVISKPDGPAPRLWLADGADEREVKAWLAQWLQAMPPVGPAASEPSAYVSVAVGRTGDVVPNALDPDAFIVSSWSSGPGGPLLTWPRVPLADLVAAGIAELTREPSS